MGGWNRGTGESYVCEQTDEEQVRATYVSKQILPHPLSPPFLFPLFLPPFPPSLLSPILSLPSLSLSRALSEYLPPFAWNNPKSCVPSSRHAASCRGTGRQEEGAQA